MRLTARVSLGVMKNDEEHMDNNEVLFFERYAAAQSLKNVWTRLASTYGCIRVVPQSVRNIFLTPCSMLFALCIFIEFRG